MRLNGSGPAAAAPPAGAVAALPARDRRLVLAGLAGIVALAWLYLGWDASSMASMAPADADQVFAAGHVGLVLAMWTVMMVGMMAPGASPAVLLYASLARRTRLGGRPFPGVWAFVLGYLAVWTAFAAAATALQVGLEQALLLSPMARTESRTLGGLLLLAAGAWQWLPLKTACLRRCRAPLPFFLTRWRPGTAGALAMGAEHGASCLGCCWALMLLLFVGGAMNLLWVALIAGFVLVEKLAPFGAAAGRAAGLALAALGLWAIAGGP